MNLFAYLSYHWLSDIQITFRYCRAHFVLFSDNLSRNSAAIYFQRKAPKCLTFGLHRCNSCNLNFSLSDYKPEYHPCVYREVNEAYRYWSNVNQTYLGCDSDTLTNGQWYRFTGDAGVMMATYCIPHWSCSAHMAGWIMNGSYRNLSKSIDNCMFSLEPKLLLYFVSSSYNEMLGILYS